MVDQRRHGNRNRTAPPRKHRRDGRGRKVTTLLLVVLLLGTLGIAGFFGFDKIRGFLIAEDYSGDGNGQEVQVEIPEGSGASAIGDVLYESGVVASAAAFSNAASAHPDATSIQAGTYNLEKEMSGEAAVEALLDPANRDTSGVTIREGLTQWGVFKTLSEETGVPQKEFEAAAKDPEKLGVPPEWFEREDGKDVKPSIEGFLFPSKYPFKSDQSAEDMLSQMVEQFLKVADRAGFKDKAKALGYSPYEVLTVASLSQAEAGIKEDLAKITRVAYNRVEKEGFFCNSEVANCLEFDTTTNYGLMASGQKSKASKDLTHDDLYNKDNKWSTHAHEGLPPTPINNPGEEAMTAAADPKDGNWLFFVAIDKSGKSAFTDDESEHYQNQQKAKENGVL